MTCYQQSTDDVQLQLDAIELELTMLCEPNEDVLPYQENKITELEERKLKLLASKRYHQNARNCYWYYVEAEKESASTMK
jgi:hypothetical protein